MAKKKNNSVFETLNANIESSKKLSAVQEQIVLSADSICLSSDNEELISDSVVDTLKNEIKRLEYTNSMLTEKLATYLDVDITDNNSNDLSGEINKLQSEINNLKNQNDQQLMKISELSFENAKLISQLQQLSKDNIKQNNQAKTPSFVSYTKTSNGYNSWN